MREGYVKFGNFRTLSCHISETVQDRTKVAIDHLNVFRRLAGPVFSTHTNVFTRVRSHSVAMCVVSCLGALRVLTNTNAHSMMCTVKMHFI